MFAMGKTQNPRRRERPSSVGSTIRQYRRAKHLTGGELAELLNVSQSTISKIENDVQSPSMDFVLGFARVVDMSQQEVAELLTLRSSGTRVDNSALGHLETFEFLQVHAAGDRQKSAYDTEISAKHVLVFQPQVVPGLLQTSDYAASVLQQAGVSHPDALREAVKQRVRRQRVLKASKKRFVFIVMEEALRRRVSDDMPAQIRQISRAADEPNIEFLVVPLIQRLTSVVPPAFAVFDDVQVHLELGHGTLRVTTARDVQIYLGMFSQLRQCALSGDQMKSCLKRLEVYHRRLVKMEGEMAETLATQLVQP